MYFHRVVIFLVSLAIDSQEKAFEPPFASVIGAERTLSICQMLLMLSRSEKANERGRRWRKTMLRSFPMQRCDGSDWISSSVRYVHIHMVISTVFQDGLVPAVLYLNPRCNTSTRTHHTCCRCGVTGNGYSVTHCDPRCDPCLTLPL